jgi:hypothetical protein
VEQLHVLVRLHLQKQRGDIYDTKLMTSPCSSTVRRAYFLTYKPY